MDEKRLSVLLIEDDEDDYILLKDLLNELPAFKFDLDWAMTYEAGREAIHQNAHDVILLDYRLGGENGLQLLDEAIQGGCEAPIIVLTGHGDYRVDLEAMRAGAADYLVKGEIGADLLERSIRHALERNQSERELTRYRDHLEELVEARTAELESANAKLQREVAERRRAEEKITQQHAFLQTVLESLTHPFYVIDARDHRVLMANSAATGGGLPQNITCHLLTHRSPQPCDGPEHFCPLETVKQTKRPSVVEHIHYTPEGEARNVEVHSYPIFDDAGNVVQMIEYALDITKRKQAEAALQKAYDELENRVLERTRELSQANEALRAEIAERKRIEESLRLEEARIEVLLELSRMQKASIEQISDFVLEQQVKLTKSSVGWLGFMNDAETVLRLHTWSKAVMEQCTVSDDPVHLPVDAVGLWTEAVKKRKPIVINDYSMPNLWKRGYPEDHIPLFRIMVVPVIDGDRIVAVAAVGNKESEYDASDLRELTLLLDGMWKLIQRERAEKALRESESLAALGKALSGLAHDMKTPLVAIGGFTRLVQKHMREDTASRKKLDIVIQETERLESMVREMLDFSRPLQLHRSPEDIHRLMQESLRLIKTMARKRRISLSNQAPHIPFSAFIDPLRMKQVLINLATNAVQASPEGGTVVVRSYLEKSSLIIDVVDRGCGIPPELREEIFSPFFTTKKGGTGLGLAIVRKIVEAHQGYLQILDNPEGGLTFRVVIPNCARTDIAWRG